MAFSAAAANRATPAGPGSNTAFLRPQQRAALPAHLLRGTLHLTQCRASSSPQQATSVARGSMNDARGSLVTAAVDTLFKFPPFFSFASTQARKMIIKRGESIGLDWQGRMAELQGVDWEAEKKQVQWAPGAADHPEYYQVPFHAYPEGNLGWTPAQEVDLAAQSVHSTVFAPHTALDPKGDKRMRQSYSAKAKELLAALSVQRTPVDVVDIGCATGLSSRELVEAFPGCSVTGVDLSEYFLAVGRWQQAQADVPQGFREHVTFVHAPGEATGLPDGCADLVSVCLVFHELPQSAARRVLREAHRLLRPGGALSIMEMDPGSEAFRRITDNVFAFTAFKSTEPYLGEYVSMDLHAEILAAGFAASRETPCTPRHRAVVAIMPEA